MAKITFYEISCGVYEIEGKETFVDTVKLQISKNVNRPTMKGVKSEIYSIPSDELPYLLGSDVQLPKRAGEDCTRRISALKDLLDPVLDKDVYAEEITKGTRKILTYLEFKD